jgi:hypothetical protein
MFIFTPFFTGTAIQIRMDPLTNANTASVTIDWIGQNVESVLGGPNDVCGNFTVWYSPPLEYTLHTLVLTVNDPGEWSFYVASIA